MSDNGHDLSQHLKDHPKVLLAALIDDNGNLQLIANGHDITKLCCAYYLLKNNVDSQVIKAVQNMQAKQSIVVAPASTLDRLRQ